MDRELAIALVAALVIMAVTARTPLLERSSIALRKLYRFIGRAVTLLVLLTGLVVIASEVATWRGPTGGVRVDAPFYSLLLWLALIVGPVAFLVGLAKWSTLGALALRISGWLLMTAALSLTSLSDIALVLMILLTPLLQRFSQPLTSKPTADIDHALL